VQGWLAGSVYHQRYSTRLRSVATANGSDRRAKRALDCDCRSPRNLQSAHHVTIRTAWDAANASKLPIVRGMPSVVQRLASKGHNVLRRGIIGSSRISN